MTVPRWLALLLACSAACSSDVDDPLGALTVVLTTQAGGVTYRLTDARFLLEGSEARELATGAEGELSVALPPGAYRLVLQDGYALARIDDDHARVAARLVSQNPLPVRIAAGETTRAVLRFEIAERGLLDAGTLPDTPTSPGPADTTYVDAAAPLRPAQDAALPVGAPAAPACAASLRIDELDYEQARTDDAEFVEVVNASACDAPLAGVRIELVNGANGKPYGQYDLAAAAATLPAGARLVLGDEAVLAALPAAVPALALRGSGLQNGPDGVRLIDGTRVLDAVAYEGEVAGSGEGAPTGADDGPAALARCPSGGDSDDNGADFRPVAPSPGLPSTCTDVAPPTRDGSDGGTQNRSATMPSSSSQR